jgi:hypothetical protein
MRNREGIDQNAAKLVTPAPEAPMTWMRRLFI